MHNIFVAYFCVTILHAVLSPLVSCAENLIVDATRFSGTVQVPHTQLSYPFLDNYMHIQNLNITIVGDGHLRALLHQQTHFYLHFELPKFTSPSWIGEPFVMVRLVSLKYIVNAQVGPMDMNKSVSKITYTLHDIGKYILQIRVTWLNGGLMSNILPIKNVSVDAFFNHSIYLDSVIYSKGIQLKNNRVSYSKVLESSSSKTQCYSTIVDSNSNNALHSLGRWVYVPPYKHCPSSVCDGNATALSWLTDRFLFNNGYVWSPWDCNLRILSTTDVQRCFVRKNISVLVFTGDSLLREHFQNTLTLLLPLGSLELKKLREDAASIELVLPEGGGHPLRVDYYVMPAQWGKSHKMVKTALPIRLADAHLLNVHTYRIQAACGSDAALAATVDSHFSGLLRKLDQHKVSRDAVTFMVNPRIQHEDLRVDRQFLRSQRNSSVANFACMTNQRQMLATDAVYKNLKSSGLAFVDQLDMTTSRWESSWDGIHYSLLLNEQSLWRYNGTKRIPQSAEHCTGKYFRGKRQSVACNDNTVRSSVTEEGALRYLRIKEFPGINKCDSRVNGDMTWCRNVASINKQYHCFEGGVSRMATMIWLNKLCSD